MQRTGLTPKLYTPAPWPVSIDSLTLELVPVDLVAWILVFRVSFERRDIPPPHKRFARRDENYLVGEPVREEMISLLSYLSYLNRSL